MTGSIVSLKKDRGFLFVEPDNEGYEGRHFVHYSKVLNANFDTLRVGDRLQFESKLGPRGLEGYDAELIT